MFNSAHLPPIPRVSCRSVLHCIALRHFVIPPSVSGGELFERVVADDFMLTEHECVLFMQQICSGVQYMHDTNIMHLDMKVCRFFVRTAQQLVPDWLIFAPVTQMR